MEVVLGLQYTLISLMGGLVVGMIQLNSGVPCEIKAFALGVNRVAIVKTTAAILSFILEFPLYFFIVQGRFSYPLHSTCLRVERKVICGTSASAEPAFKDRKARYVSAIYIRVLLITR